MTWTGGGSSGSAAGTTIVRHFSFAHNTAGILTGHALYTPTIGDILYDAWVEVDTAWNGTTPLCDVGQFLAVSYGFFAAFGANSPFAVDMSLADIVQTGTGLLVQGTNSHLTSDLLQAQIGGTAPTQRFMPAKLTTADPIKVCVSQDGTNATVAAFLLAANAPPTIPLVVVTGVNDTFVWTGTAGGGSPETFTVAAGSKANLAAIVAAMGAATGSVSGEAFSTKATPTADATKILLTSVVDSGVGGNGDTVTAGSTDVLAGLGFDSPSTFAGGTGGNPGSTVGAAILYLVTSTPA